MKASVIIVWTNETQLAEAQKWIKKQTIYNKTEIILLDNRENKNYKSAAQALNIGAEKAIGDMLFFMHQDVYLWDNIVLEKYCDFLSKNKKAIIGAAGTTHEAKTYTDLYETMEKIHRGEWAKGQVVEVDSVDECIFAMHRETWERLKFDEKCCDDWHCYALEICLNNRIHGGKNYVVPVKICHDSLGNSNQRGFVHTVKNLVWKYYGTGIKRIESTCVSIKCSRFSYYIYALEHCIRQYMKKIIIF